MIAVEKVRNRIHLVSPRPTPGLGGKIPGANFCKGSNGKSPYWSLPLSIETCRALRETFGKTLEIGPDLWDWAQAAIEAELAMAELLTATDAELVRVPAIAPKLAEAMGNRTYQRVGAAFLARFGGGLLGDEMGLGKTLQAIAAVIEADVPGPYLVICPKTAVEAVWASEITRWVPDVDVVTTPDGREARNFILGDLLEWSGSMATQEELNSTWVVVHPEMVRTKSFWVCGECGSETPVGPRKQLICCHATKNAPRRDDHEFPQLFNFAWGAIVIDESQQVLVRRVGVNTQARNGAELLPIHPEGIKIAMSGTPFRSRPHLFWGTLNWLRPAEHPSFWNWAETYYEVQATWGGGREIGRARPEKAEQLSKSLDRVMIRRTAREVAPDLPPKTYVGTPLDGTLEYDPTEPVAVWLPMDGKQAKAYRAMARDSVAAIEGGDLNAIGVLAEYTRLKQFATASGRINEREEFEPALPSNKFEYLVDMLLNMGFPDDPTTKVVVASQFTSVLNLFARELPKRIPGIEICMVTGQVTGEKRTQAIAEFNRTDGGPSVMFLNTKAGGVAITIDSADEMVILDRTGVPDNELQLEGRIYRVSNPRKVRYRYLHSLDSIEHQIVSVSGMRGRDSDLVLDGRRGVQAAERVLELV